jgi:hypothetical protein
MVYTTEWQRAVNAEGRIVCKACGCDDVEEREWESRWADYVERHLHCTGCGKDEWIDLRRDA